jgi:hypothetical protein
MSRLMLGQVVTKQTNKQTNNNKKLDTNYRMCFKWSCLCGEIMFYAHKQVLLMRRKSPHKRSNIPGNLDRLKNKYKEKI